LKPENPGRKNKGKADMSRATPSIREYLEAHPLKTNDIIYGLCEKHGVDLNSPWPPVFSGSEQAVVLRSLWPESHRAGPNAIFRSALFPSLNFKEGRPFLKKKEIYSVGGITVLFTGERFDQSDLDVYLELLHLAAAHPLGTEVSFSAHALLKAIGRSTGSSDYEWLDMVLTRLCGGVVDITDHRIGYFGQLLQGGLRDETTLNYTISINPKFAALFTHGLWSKIDHEQRQGLGRSMTAKALHAYYSTHAAPGPHNFETLAGVAGLEGKNRRDVKARIIKAHESLKEEGFLTGFQMTGNMIKVDLKPTPSQVRHLARKIARRAKG
jgi:hypothetical protein